MPSSSCFPYDCLGYSPSPGGSFNSHHWVSLGCCSSLGNLLNSNQPESVSIALGIFSSDLQRRVSVCILPNPTFSNALFLEHGEDSLYPAPSSQPPALCPESLSLFWPASHNVLLRSQTYTPNTPSLLFSFSLVEEVTKPLRLTT